MQSPFYKQNKITKVDISLKQLLDVDTTNELYYRRTDNIQPNQVLTSYTNSLRRDAFRFKYLTDLIQAGSGVTITELDGILTISASGGGGGTGTVTSIDVDGGTGISVSPSGPITTSGTFTVTNTAPDQTVVLNNGTGISVTGTYPNFTIASTITGGSGLQHAIASGTDTYTATITGVTAYAEGDAYLIRFTNGNTTSCTLNINGLGARTLYRNNDGVLIGGDIIANGDMLCVYDTSLPGFRVIGTAPNTLLGYVTNDDSVTLTKGMAVYAFGGTGDRMTVKRANNTADATSAQTVGLVLSPSIAANQKGLIMMQGLLDGLSILPTSTFADGDPVYLGATPGGITKTKPYAPNHLVYLGVVTTASPGSAGRMYVKVQNGYELDELHNVQAQTPSLKDTLWYDNAVSPAQWKTASIPTILGYTPVPTTRQLTINGVAQDLSVDRTWTIPVSGATVYSQSINTTRYDNWAITGFATATNDGVIKITASGIQNTVIGGMTGGVDGRVLTLINSTTSSLIILESASTSSTAANTFFNPDSTPMFLRPGESIRFVYDGTNSRWALQGVKNYQNTFQTFDDYYIGGAAGGLGSATSQSAGTTYITVGGSSITNGDLAAVSGQNNSVGCLIISLGTALNNRGYVGTNRAFNGASMVNGSHHIFGRLAISPTNPALINNGIDFYRIWLGFGDIRSPAAGAYWAMDNSAGSTVFNCITNNGVGTITTTASPITYVAGSSLINLGVYIWRTSGTFASFSQACFYYTLDGVTYVIAASHTTGFPSGGSAAGSPGWGVNRQSAGTNSINFFLDYLGHNQHGTPGSGSSFR